MSGLEGGLQQLEAELAKQFGDHSDDGWDEDGVAADAENAGGCERESARERESVYVYVCVCVCMHVCVCVCVCVYVCVNLYA